MVIGPGAPIVLPKNSTRPDYEAEFAFVIGPGGRHISAARALDHVFGYTIVNDVSARDFQMATSQWLMGKTFDTFAPMGPWIVVASDIDYNNLNLTTRVNGVVKQQINTSKMYFKVPRLVAELSLGLILEPGDINATGTPVGIGAARTPPEFLKPGDILETEIDQIGTIRNTIQLGTA